MNARHISAFLFVLIMSTAFCMGQESETSNEEKNKTYFRFNAALPIAVNGDYVGDFDWGAGISIWRYSFWRNGWFGWTRGGVRTIFLDITHTILDKEEGKVQYFGLKIPYPMYLIGESLMGEIALGAAIDDDSNVLPQMEARIKWTFYRKPWSYLPALTFGYRRFHSTGDADLTNDFLNAGICIEF